MELLALLATTNSSIKKESLTTPLSSNEMIIPELARYAIKGLAPDKLSSISLSSDDKTFPDDRRFALLKQKYHLDVVDDTSDDNPDKESVFNEMDPEWLHKENFLCAFTDPEFMAQFKTSYEIVKRNDSDNTNDRNEIQRLLTVSRRSNEETKNTFDLNSIEGRNQLAEYFVKQQPPSITDKASLACITQAQSQKHKHQFGNTSSGFKKNNGESRTIHIVNEATVRDVEEKVNDSDEEEDTIQLNAMRFRPNIVVDGLEPWKEFDFVGKRLKVIRNNSDEKDGTIILKVLSKTVRCAGIGVDPSQPEAKKLDVPQLLSKHFPQYGPYLGVYAVIECQSDDGNDDTEFHMSVGDRIQLIDE